MAKVEVLQALYNKRKSPLEFNFDNLTAPPLLSLLSLQDIAELNRIAKSVKLAGKIDEKYKMIDHIMNNRGFVKLHAGTNRVVYRFLEDQRFVIKVAVDRVGINDNPSEFKNQFLLKPFVTKVFEVSPCGTVGLFERVDAIMSREEFLSVADDIFNVITKIFVGKYILDDFGSHYFMNWGVRRNGYGLVLLDFPYVYELDGNKLYCNAPIIPGRHDIPCGGQLDYDDGFNNLVCTKCGKHYQARELKKAEKENLIVVGGKKTMKLKVIIDGRVVKDTSKNKIAKVIEPLPENNVVEEKKEEIIKSKVQARTNVPAPKVQSKPNDGIFKKEEKKEDIIKENVIEEENRTVLESPNLSELVNEESKTTLDTMEEELNAVLEESNNNDEDDYEEDDYEDYNYDHYLNNRQRNNIRSSKKVFKKGNSDFSNF